MGDILPFIARVRANGDWTQMERARLEELARHFATHAPGVEAVFGVSEDGDPWCVVKDEHEDVLVHVARIDGRFVVHYAVNDAVDEGADLHAALGRRLGDVAASASNVVNGLFLGDRHAQTLAALLIAAAFFYETSEAKAAEVVLAAPPREDRPSDTPILPPVHKDDPHARTDRDVAAHGAALLESAPPVVVAEPPHRAEAPAAPAESAEHIIAATVAAQPQQPPPPPMTLASVAVAEPAAFAPNMIFGTSGDDHLVGTAGADHIIGGAGNDNLEGGGAPQGLFDVLDGGAGNDVIQVNAQIVAIGGEGADTFVLAMPPRPPPPSDAATESVTLSVASAPGRPVVSLLGVIADFNAREGDRVVNARGQAVDLRGHVETTAAPESANAGLAAAGDSTMLTMFGVTGRRVDVDLDGDGKIDGYLVMGGRTVIEVTDSGRHIIHDASVLTIGGAAPFVDDII